MEQRGGEEAGMMRSEVDTSGYIRTILPGFVAQYLVS